MDQTQINRVNANRDALFVLLHTYMDAGDQVKILKAIAADLENVALEIHFRSKSKE